MAGVGDVVRGLDSDWTQGAANGVQPTVNTGELLDMADLTGAKPPLSKEALAAREPLPPLELVDAIQDRVHTEPGHGRGVKTVRRGQRALEVGDA